jgi:hypothetical protein
MHWERIAVTSGGGRGSIRAGVGAVRRCGARMDRGRRRSPASARPKGSRRSRPSARRIGAGLDFGSIGVYVAKSTSTGCEPMNVIVRWGGASDVRRRAPGRLRGVGPRRLPALGRRSRRSARARASRSSCPRPTRLTAEGPLVRSRAMLTDASIARTPARAASPRACTTAWSSGRADASWTSCSARPSGTWWCAERGLEQKYEVVQRVGGRGCRSARSTTEDAEAAVWRPMRVPCRRRRGPPVLLPRDARGAGALGVGPGRGECAGCAANCSRRCGASAIPAPHSRADSVR